MVDSPRALLLEKAIELSFYHVSPSSIHRVLQSGNGEVGSRAQTVRG